MKRFFLRPWPALVLTILICLPTLLIDLTTRECTHTMENVAVVVSMETWLRLHEGDQLARFVTYKDDRLRVEKPPMTTWLSFLAWSDLDPGHAVPDQLLARARFVAVVMGVILLASIFWMGLTLHDVRLAVTATLVVAATFFFERQARYASYDIHYVAWLSLAMAAALWAMQPLENAPSRRRLAGWVVSALSLTMAILSKDPLPLGLFAACMGTTVVVLPGDRSRRKRAALSLLAVAVFATLIAGTWYVYALNTVPLSIERLRAEFAQARTNPGVWYYYAAALFGLLLPWPIWLVGGLLQPLTRDWQSQRRRLLIPWLWFVCILVLMSIPPAKQQRYILPIIPAAGLLIAHAWRPRPGGDGFGASKPDPLAILAREAHWGALALGSIALGVFCVLQKRQATPTIEPLNWASATLLSAALLAVAVIGWRMHRRGRVHWGIAATAVWMFIVMGAWWHLTSTLPTSVHPIRLEAERMAAIVGDQPVRRLRTDDIDRGIDKLNKQFRMYYGKLILPIWCDQVAEFSSGHVGARYLLVRDVPETTELLKDSGFVAVDQFQTNHDEVHHLWKAGG